MISSIPLITASISFCGFLIALYKVWDEQKKYHKLRYNQEKRLEYKIRLYEILLSEILPIEKIISKFQSHAPFSKIDEIEIRKSIYEMIVEKNIVAFEDGCYTVDTASLEENQS